MKNILRKCEMHDFNYLSEVLDNYLAFTDDGKRKKLLLELESYPSKKEELVVLIDEQIRYFGSADGAYFARVLLGKNGAVSANEMVSDVCEKLKVKVKEGGSIESRLEQLVSAVVDKEVRSKKPAELAKMFKDMNIGDKESELFISHLKANGEVLIIPLLFEFLGPKVALGIIESIVVGLIATIVGKQAAQLIVKEFMKRNPWLNALGPVMWVISGTWLALDLQGPAYRKTIPICLYLGIVGLRDGQEVA